MASTRSRETGSAERTRAASTPRCRSLEPASRPTDRDALTQLPNRRYLLNHLTHLRKTTGGRSGVHVTVLALDLDNFSVINECLGSQAGDAVLVTVAGRIQDLLPLGDVVARDGGDEFVVVSNIGGDGDAHRLARQLLTEIALPMTIGDQDRVVTACIGLSISTDHLGAPEQVLLQAGAALHAAKEVGCDRYVAYEPSMHARASLHLETEAALRRAVDTDQLLVYYQPLVDLETGTTAGAEALVRWERPGHGLVGPDAFIPIAEQSGLIEAIGEGVLRSACRDLATWRSAGLVPETFTVSVNVAERQLHGNRLAGTLRHCLRTFDVAPEHLCFEVTESSIMVDVPRSSAVLDDLKRIGVAVAIDDFGKGHSSLAHLRSLPVDILKIDRMFMEHLRTDRESTAIVATIIAMADLLGISAVAEGIETGSQLETLRQLRCPLGQGFYFLAPSPADAFLRYVRDGAVEGGRW